MLLHQPTFFYRNSHSMVLQIPWETLTSSSWSAAWPPPEQATGPLSRRQRPPRALVLRLCHSHAHSQPQRARSTCGRPASRGWRWLPSNEIASHSRDTPCRRRHTCCNVGTTDHNGASAGGSCGKASWAVGQSPWRRFCRQWMGPPGEQQNMHARAVRFEIERKQPYLQLSFGNLDGMAIVMTTAR